MRVNEKIEKITEDTLKCGIDVGKTNCCVFVIIEDWRCIKKHGLIELRVWML